MRKKEKREKDARVIRGRIWNGSIVAALVAALAVFGVMLRLEKNMLTQYERGKILVASREIPKGTMINEENCALLFQEKEIDAGLIPESAIVEREQLMGMAAGNTIDSGVLLTNGMFESLNEITKGMAEPVIAGFRAEDLYQVAGGTLRVGDRIHIYNLDEDGKAVLKWNNLYVQQAFDNSGAAILPEEARAAQRINVYMDKKDVEKFYSEMAAGTLRVVKVCD